MPSYELVTLAAAQDLVDAAVAGIATTALWVRVGGLMYTTTGATLIRPGIRCSEAFTATAVRVVLNDAVVGDSVVFKAYLNGVLKATVTIAAAGTTAVNSGLSVPVVAGDVWTFECTVGGSASFPGAYAAIYIES